MSRIIQPVVSPRGRVILLSGATLWLVAAMALSAVPGGAAATPGHYANVTTSGVAEVIETIPGTEGLLFYPRVVADQRGGLFVADRGSHRVIRLDEQLRATTVFGREGAGPGEMRLPYGVAVDSRGNVFVVDLELDRISKFRADGTFVRSVAAPQAATVLVDANDELLVYPAPGRALMRRYSNDLEPGEELFAETDDLMHRLRMGVLMAMDRSGHLFLLDQTDLSLTVYGRDLRPILRWTVDGDELHESLAARIASVQAKNPDGRVRVPAFQSMAVDPRGDHIAFAYQVWRSDEESFTRVVWYTTDGSFLASEDRDELVLANALLPDGRLLEGTSEALHVFTRGSASPITTRGN